MRVKSALFVASLALSMTLSHDGLAGEPQAGIDAAIRTFLEQHPEDVQRIVKDYLIKNPSVVQEALAALIKMRGRASKPSNATDKAEIIKSNAEELFRSTHQIILGNPHGRTTIVEFFDYNCGYCKRALADMLELIHSDPEMRIVLKEYPILGPGSAEAARVAIAVHLQDRNGEKYLAFHKQMLAALGPANRDRALAVAQSLGLDQERLEADLASEEVAATLTEIRRLAQTLEINGTPSYVVGNEVLTGAVGLSALQDRIAAIRR